MAVFYQNIAVLAAPTAPVSLKYTHPVNMGTPGSPYSREYGDPTVNTGTPSCERRESYSIAVRVHIHHEYKVAKSGSRVKEVASELKTVRRKKIALRSETKPTSPYTSWEIGISATSPYTRWEIGRSAKNHSHPLRSKTLGRSLFSAIYNYFLSQQYPEGASKLEKNALRRQAKYFRVRNDHMYYVGGTKAPSPVAPRLVVEDLEQRKRIVANIHNTSHLGLNRTNDMV